MAEATAEGVIRLIDRKRNILKLASGACHGLLSRVHRLQQAGPCADVCSAAGETVAVEALEAKYSKAPSVAQMWIYATRCALSGTAVRAEQQPLLPAGAQPSSLVLSAVPLHHSRGRPRACAQR